MSQTAPGTTSGAAGGPPVLLVGSLPPPSGGIATHVVDLARLGEAHGFAMRLAPVGTGRGAARLALLGHLAAARLQGHVVHLHTNGHNARSWHLARLVATLAGPRAVLTLHSGFAPAWIASHARACRAGVEGFFAVLCVSPAIADALVEAGADPARLLVAPAFSAAALPLPLPPAGLAAIRRRHRPLIAAALSAGREYGADLLVESFAMLQCTMRDAGLVLYGPAARAPRLAATLRDRGLAGSVHRFGDLGRAASLAVVAAADVFVRPTRTDGDSISVREALGLGRRVVASDAAARPAGVHLFSSGDPASLAVAVAGALSAPAPMPAVTDALAPVFALYRRLQRRDPRAPGALEVAATQHGVAAPPRDAASQHDDLASQHLHVATRDIDLAPQQDGAVTPSAATPWGAR